MDKDPDNRVFFDHGGLTAFDDGKNQLLKPTSSPTGQREFQQEVSENYQVRLLQSLELTKISVVFDLSR
jgi:hypothetical protein